jgi:ferric-dicitrate binding protein FerR (iron transport regulator)
MENYQKYQKYRPLIYKYLTGKLYREESKQLLDWLEEDPRHKDYFYRVKREWNPFDDADESVNEAYGEIQCKLAMSQTLDKEFDKSSGRIKWWINNSLKVAAVLLIGILIGRFINFSEQSITPEETQELSYTTINSPSGEKSHIMLPDSSTVWLNSESTIKFPSGGFRDKRMVDLQGEAFFNVKKGQTKFIVKTADYSVNVKGTEFNVMAYKDFGRTQTTVVEGAIEVNKGNQTFQVGANEKIVYEKGSFTKQPGNIFQATAWKDNIFYFDKVPFNELVRRLERWYDVNINLKSEELSDIEYSGVFRNEETIWQVLDVIQMTTPISYNRNEFREIVITSKLN